MLITINIPDDTVRIMYTQLGQVSCEEGRAETLTLKEICDGAKRNNDVQELLERQRNEIAKLTEKEMHADKLLAEYREERQHCTCGREPFKTLIEEVKPPEMKPSKTNPAKSAMREVCVWMAAKLLEKLKQATAMRCDVDGPCELCGIKEQCTAVIKVKRELMSIVQKGAFHGPEDH